MDKFISKIINDTKQNKALICIVFVPILIFLIIIPIQPFYSITFLVSDPNKRSWAASIVSDVGLYCWVITVCITFFTAFVLSKIPNKNFESKFLLIMGSFSLYLLADDRLMIHESFGTWFFVVLILVMMSILYYYRKFLLQTNYFLLLFALFCLGMSVGVDVLIDDIIIMESFTGNLSNMLPLSPNRIEELLKYLEDGPKLLGIVGWTLFFLNFCYLEIKSIVL